MVYENMVVKTGSELKSMVDAALDVSEQPYKERFALNDLHRYMTSPPDKKVCCLYGLRRTGKTIMAMQEMRKLDDYDNVLFVGCSADKTMWDLRVTVDTFLKEHPNCKNIFIDEVTALNGFINACAFLADDYAVRGIKVVLVGTDSLGLWIARNHELFCRAHFLHTTYIPFKEFNYLLDGDIDDYIKYGGTLTTGEELVFLDNESTARYIDSAIVSNIQSSLKKWNRGENIGTELLGDIIDSGDEFKSIVNKVLELHNYRFLAKNINKAFNANDIGSLKNLLVNNAIADPQFLDTDELRNKVREYLEIKERQLYQVDQKTADTIADYLKRLDVLYQVPKVANLNPSAITEYIFTQVGMRYVQARQQAAALCASPEFGNYDAIQQREILKKLDEDIRGGILEDVIFTQLSKEVEPFDLANSTYAVSKYRDAENREIDLLMLNFDNETVLAIEVKHSEKIVENQTRHLLDEEMCEGVKRAVGFPITNKAVVYRGNSGESKDGVLYINASDFLTRSQEMTKTLLEHRHITSFAELDALIKQDALGSGDGEHKPDPPKKKRSTGQEH